jgi:hypothetical protein
LTSNATYYTWGAQLEKVGYLRSYAPTTNGPNDPFDTLYLKEFGSGDPAHLDVGDLTVHGDLTVYGAAVLNAGILEEIFASAEFASAFTSAFYSSIASIVGAGIGSALQFVGNVLGIDPAAVPSIGGLTIADDNSVKPATDGHSSIGEASKMMAHIYTRELIVGNYTAHPSNYMTFYDDGTGLNLVMTTSQSTGGIIPASGKQLNLGSSSQKWQTIYCNELNTTQISGLTNPVTITTSNAPQLTIAASNAALKFHTDCNIYRTSKTIQGTNYVILETDNPFVCTLLDCNGLSVNNNAGITGNLNLGGTLSFNGSAGSDGQVLKNVGGYPQWANAGTWNGGTVQAHKRATPETNPAVFNITARNKLSRLPVFHMLKAQTLHIQPGLQDYTPTVTTGDYGIGTTVQTKYV